MATGTGFGLGNTVATTTSTTVASSFNLVSNTVPTVATPGLSFDASKAASITPATTGFSLATTTTSGFGFGTSKPMTGI